MFYIKRQQSALLRVYISNKDGEKFQKLESLEEEIAEIFQEKREKEIQREQVQFLLVNYGSIKKKDSAIEEILVLKMLLHLNTGK